MSGKNNFVKLRFVEIPEHTETPEHIGNYQNTLKKDLFFLLNK